MGRSLYVFLQDILAEKNEPAANSCTQIIEDTLTTLQNDLLARHFRNTNEARYLCRRLLTALAPYLSAQARSRLLDTLQHAESTQTHNRKESTP